MSVLLPLTIIGGSALCLLAWYLRRPPVRHLRLASARFLGALTAASDAPLRPSIATLLRTRWLAARLLIILLLAAPFLITAADPIHGGRPRLAVRVLVDVSASMQVDGPEGTRLAEAARLVRALNATLAETKSAHICPTTAALVDTTVQDVDPLALDAALARERPLVGAAGALLVAEATRPSSPNACPLTHVIVVSDLPKPAIEQPEDGRVVLWWQVGAPQPNIGIDSVTIDTDLFGTHPAIVSVAVRRFGGAQAPSAVRITGPDNRALAGTVPDWKLPDKELSLSFEAATAGSYVVELGGAGAFTGDDRVVIDVPNTLLPSFDWRLTDTPPPRSLRLGTGKDSVLIALLSPAALTEAEDRRAILVLGPLTASTGGPPRLGAFISDDPLLTDVNLEIIDRSAPAAAALPGRSWVPVLYGEEQSAARPVNVLAARRSQPTAAIIPGPPPRGSSDVVNAGNLLLFNALSYVLQDRRPILGVRRTAPDGREVLDAFLESDTAYAVDRGDRSVAVLPLERARGASGRPLWPWFVVAGLVLLLIERWRGLDAGRRP